jgi:hypothetical protein
VNSATGRRGNGRRETGFESQSAVSAAAVHDQYLERLKKPGFQTRHSRPFPESVVPGEDQDREAPVAALPNGNGSRVTFRATEPWPSE